MQTQTFIGTYAPDFELPGIDGEVHHLSHYLQSYQAVGVIFMCNHCPYVRLYLDRLKQIQADFSNASFTLIGINANDAIRYPEDSFDNMQIFATDHQLNFPYIRDVNQDVALSFNAQRTPEAFLIDKNGVIRYCGCIDDSPNNIELIQVSYLRNAINNLLASEDIAQPMTEAVGCSVKWRH